MHFIDQILQYSYVTHETNPSHLNSLSFENECLPTIDQDRGRVAFAASDDVLGHARVVARVGQPGLLDDKIVVGRDEEIGVALWVDHILVPLPLHLKESLIG